MSQREFPKKFIADKVEKLTDLKHLVEYGKRTYGDKNFLTYKKNQIVQNVTYNEMHTLVQRLGTAFFKKGIMGENVAIISETRYEWIVSYFAVVNGNGIIIPLDKELSEEQIINFIERSKAVCIVYSDSFAKLIENYAKESDVSGKKAKLFVNLDLEPENEILPEYKDFNIYSFGNLLKTGEKALNENCKSFTDLKIDNEKPCAYLFTSGTTGTSKAVMLSHKNIASNAYNAACCVDIGKDAVIVSVLPAHHTYETTCTFLADYALGTNICVNESLKMVMRNFQFYKPTKMVLVPLFVDNIVKKIREEIKKKGKTKFVENAVNVSNALRKVGIDLRRKLFKEILDSFGGRVDAIICGGAPLNPEHIKYLDGFGIKIWQGYGITECSPLVSVVPEDMWMKKCGSVGYPIFENEVKIGEKDENGYGEILVKGDNVMIGYLDNEEATKEVFTEDGFFKTGDVGYIDKDGYIYITGRRKNIIILSNGKNIYPEEIEEYLFKIEEIKECAVIARTKENGESNITALIFPDFDKFEGKDFKVAEAKIKEEVDKINKLLPTFKQITEIDVRQFEFEKTTTKKIKRYMLK